MAKKAPRLHVVADRGKVDLDDFSYVLGPDQDAAPKGRLPRSKDFTRVWIPTLPEWGWLYPPRARLWLVLWYRSHEGTKPVTLDREIAKEAGIPLRRRQRYAVELENRGVVQVERHGRQTLVLTILIRRSDLNGSLT